MQRVLVSFQFDNCESVIKRRQIANANLIAALLNLRRLNLNRAHRGSRMAMGSFPLSFSGGAA